MTIVMVLCINRRLSTEIFLKIDQNSRIPAYICIYNYITHIYIYIQLTKLLQLCLSSTYVYIIYT